MIIGIGTDIVEIKRFAHWQTYAQQRLQRIFSDQEITYCVQSPIMSAQRFAVRFAAKESLVKALTGMNIALSLLYVCRHVSIVKTECKSPFFVVSDTLKKLLPKGTIFHLSLAHTRNYATAFVVIEVK